MTEKQTTVPAPHPAEVSFGSDRPCYCTNTGGKRHEVSPTTPLVHSSGEIRG